MAVQRISSARCICVHLFVCVCVCAVKNNTSFRTIHLNPSNRMHLLKYSITDETCIECVNLGEDHLSGHLLALRKHADGDKTETNIQQLQGCRCGMQQITSRLL